MEFSSNKGLRECLRRGVGVTVCPAMAIEPALASGELVTLQWTGETVEAAVFMIWHQDKWCSPLLERFMGLVRDVVGSVRA